MGKKISFTILITGAIAYFLYKNKKSNTIYYIGKAETLRDELERKIAEKTQELNVHN